MVLSDLPAAMADTGGRVAGYWPVIQLFKDWNNQPESRDLMLAGGLAEGTDTVIAAKVAAVVHTNSKATRKRSSTGCARCTLEPDELQRVRSTNYRASP